MKNSSIEWCDSTFNPWIGCTKVSPGCAHCYAEALMDTRLGRVKWGKGQPRQRTSADYWSQPLKWNREYEELAHCANLAGEYIPRRPRVFCASLADWLDGEVPIDWLSDLLDLIRCTPSLNWLLLTKRPQNFRERLERVSDRALREGHYHLLAWLDKTRQTDAGWLEGRPPANVWVGTTVEDQQRADKRIPALIGIPAKVRFLSCEPLLGPVAIEEHLDRQVDGGYFLGSAPIHWVICGGESGKEARPMHPDWARSLRDQCASRRAPFFMKQMGGVRKPFADIPSDLLERKFPEIAPRINKMDTI